jgi:hypothetical protein
MKPPRQSALASNTLLKWMKLPEFQKAYREARRAAFSQSIARLQQGTSAAATTLIKLLLDPATPASVRARVADSILRHVVIGKHLPTQGGQIWVEYHSIPDHC